ncbi:MAG: hypothetical protein WBO69_13075 [Thermoanaerobaculia bacterium]
MPLSDGFGIAQDGLHTEERVLIDDRLEVAHDVDAPGIVADPAGVERVFEQVPEAL